MTDPDQSHIDLSEVETAQAAVASAEAATEIAVAEAKKKQQELYDRVAEGETTGDQLVDLVIIRNRGHNPEAVDLFRSLEGRVAAHVGEPVLVISRTVEYAGHSFLEGGTHPYVSERLGVGILSGGELNIGEGGAWSFPTDSHVIRGGKPRPDEGVEFEPLEGPLDTNLGGFGFLQMGPLEGALDTEMDLEPGTSNLATPGTPTHLEIAVGTKEIQALIEKNTWFDQDHYEQMLDVLLRLPSAKTPKE